MLNREEQDRLIEWLRMASPSALRAVFQDREFRHTANDVFNAWRMRTQIRQLREAQGWTQTDLGAATGMTQSAIARLENMYAPVDVQIRTLQRIAKALDVRLKIGFLGWLSLIADIFNMSCRIRPTTFTEEFGKHSSGSFRLT